MAELTGIEVNGDVLAWARETSAMNKTKASESSGISLSRLEQLESGNKQPSLQELRTLSKTYRRTIATLLLNSPPPEKPLPRDRRTVNSEIEIGTFSEKTIIAIRKARAIAQSLLELKTDAGISVPKFSESALISDDPSEVASRLRDKWNLSEVRGLEKTNDALEAYIEKVEILGVAVFQLSLTQDNVRGFSIVDDVIPIVGIKGGGEPTTAKIFTLFHEVGHLLLNEGGICDISDKSTIQIEKWCNSFAANLLIPSNELLKQSIVQDYYSQGITAWPKKDLIQLGQVFHVGPLSILRALLENGRTSSNFYSQKHDSWNKPTFGRAKNPEGRNLPKEILREKGRTYVSLAFRAFDQNRIDLKDLSDFLGLKLRYIPKTRQLLNV
ncbi:MAG: XRE family transcriptional regulator [Cyclobacteriaceae bacterium]